MCALATSLTFLVFCVVFQCGNALFECPVPPNSSLIYLDLARLNSLALQQDYHNSVHSPLLCLKGEDEECSEQKCCPHEVGCCLGNRKDEKHVRECGCKEANSDQCTFPAPYAILATDECSASEKTQITACLRERRANEYLIKQTAWNTENKSYGRSGILHGVKLISLLDKYPQADEASPESSPLGVLL